jgi:HD superfamily phosphohydrolase YqeK
MFAEGSTDGGFGDLSPLEMEAARGRLPEWARATPSRRDHMARVAALLEEWARELSLEEHEALRWSAAGWLHDALRDEDPARLLPLVGTDARDLPGAILHGPAAATLLEGQVDRRVVQAVRYHTIGHPILDELGRALYLADFLEPGRQFDTEWREELRARMPEGRLEVLLEVIAARIRHQVDGRKPIRPETAAFWSAAVIEHLR